MLKFLVHRVFNRAFDRDLMVFDGFSAVTFKKMMVLTLEIVLKKKHIVSRFLEQIQVGMRCEVVDFVGEFLVFFVLIFS